jgi:hypothetical protein
MSDESLGPNPLTPGNDLYAGQLAEGLAFLGVGIGIGLISLHKLDGPAKIVGLILGFILALNGALVFFGSAFLTL